MRLQDLKEGMIVQTEHNRFGVVERERNRIHFCYDPGRIHDKDKRYEMVSLDDIFEFDDGCLGVGFIVTNELKEKYPECYEDFEVGGLCIAYDIVAVYSLSILYDNGVGTFPDIIVE